MVCVIFSGIYIGNKLVPDNYLISKRAIFSCAAVFNSSFGIWNRQEQNKKNDNDETDNNAFFHIFSPSQILFFSAAQFLKETFIIA